MRLGTEGYRVTAKQCLMRVLTQRTQAQGPRRKEAINLVIELIRMGARIIHPSGELDLRTRRLSLLIINNFHFDNLNVTRRDEEVSRRRR